MADLHGTIISVTFALFCSAETQVRRINIPISAFLNAVSVSGPGNVLDRIFKGMGVDCTNSPVYFKNQKCIF